MNAERWQRIKALFEAASDLAPNKRDGFLDNACGGDEELKQEINKLLASRANADSFLESPAVAQAPSLFEEKKTAISPGITGETKGGDFVAGTVLASRYRILGLLGKGGMGEVYKAEDLQLSQVVALKFLPVSVERDTSMLTLFRGEVRHARQVSHPNVCRVFDIGEIDGRHFLSMEHVDGDDLSSLLKRVGRLPSERGVEISRQLCVGLSAIHKAGILHRDFKPANIIIDSKGDARITDFGIAGLEADIAADNMRVGTPAYMSPEQIGGKGVTARSDIYSLGLVLYEIFTGKQAFTADTIHELIRKHQSETPTNPSEHVKGIDPLVESVIAQCLEKDPNDRPPSALHVALALPGGNPLQVALEAGETPSPEMVAAAPKKGALKPAVAIACLAAIVALFAFIVFFSGRVKLIEWVPLDKPPEAMAERANQIVNKLGYTDPPTHTVYAYDQDSSYSDYAKLQDASPDRFEKIRTGQPATLYFWYRTSPRYLVPSSTHEVSSFDPPIDISGMTRVALDVRGRLIGFQAVPPEVEEKATQNMKTDWPALLAEAGLDIRNYTETESQRTPPYFADERKAWEGTNVDHPEIPVRIEAAAFHGRVIHFSVIFPWEKPTRQTALSVTAADNSINIFFTILFFSALSAALIIARHNLKVGRGDLKGALKLGVFMFSVMTLARLIDNYHVPELNAELSIVFLSASNGLALGVITWIFYIALEPFIRRRWSELMISWSRLLAGDFRDPLVGRDILIGILLGLSGTFVLYSMFLLHQWLGIALPPYTHEFTTEPLSGVDGMAVHFLHQFSGPVSETLAVSFVLLILLTVLRKKRLAVAALWLVILAPRLIGAIYGSWLPLIGDVVMATLMTIAIARFGLLAVFFYLVVVSMSFGNPITSDFSNWYARSTFFVFVVLMSLAIYGFYTCLAGKPVFGGKILREQ